MADLVSRPADRLGESSVIEQDTAHLPVPDSAEPTAPRVRWELFDLDCYRVHVDDAIVGYIDVVGRVFVALSGARNDRAVEVAQSLVFERAIAVLVDGASRAR